MARKRRATPLDIPKSIELPDDLPIIQDTATYFSPDPEEKPTKQGAGAVVVHHLVTFLQIVVVMGFGIWAYLTFKNVDFFENSAVAETSPLEPYAAANQLLRINTALRVYEALNEELPRNLEGLVDENILLVDDLSYPGNREFLYERRADTFDLTLVPRARPVESRSEEGIVFD